MYRLLKMSKNFAIPISHIYIYIYIKISKENSLNSRKLLQG